jgi:hypothetical protein
MQKNMQGMAANQTLENGKLGYFQEDRGKSAGITVGNRSISSIKALSKFIQK